METINFESLTLDSALDRLQVELAALSPRQAAAFFVTCGRALFPLYAEFVAETGWGDLKVLQHAESIALDFAKGGRASIPKGTNGLLQLLADVVPDGEVFDAPSSTFAQDVVICMDAAVRATDPGESVNPAWIEYVLEPATSAAAEEETGYTSPGTSSADLEWRDRALNHPGLRMAFQTAAKLIEMSAAKSVFSEVDLGRFRTIASGLLIPRAGSIPDSLI